MPENTKHRDKTSHAQPGKSCIELSRAVSWPPTSSVAARGDPAAHATCSHCEEHHRHSACIVRGDLLIRRLNESPTRCPLGQSLQQLEKRNIEHGQRSRNGHAGWTSDRRAQRRNDRRCRRRICPVGPMVDLTANAIGSASDLLHY